MLSKWTIIFILQNKKYYRNGFYKNEFREAGGHLELDDGQVISYEQVEERIRDEENYYDPLFHLLEIWEEENEGYYSNIVFFNKCDSEGYWNGFDVNGFNKYGYNKYGYNKKGYDGMGFNKNCFNKFGYKNEGYDSDGYIENWCDFDVNDLEGYDTVL